MKFIYMFAIMLLCVTNTLAATGDADAIAGVVKGIGQTILIYGIIGACIGVCVACWFGCCALWNKATTLGKLVIFGLPLTAISGCIFYALFYIACPWILSILPLLIHNPFVYVLSGIVLELILILIGWKSESTYTVKRSGIIPTVSRGIVLLPILPAIYIIYYLVQLFKLACIKDAVAVFNPHIVRKEKREQ